MATPGVLRADPAARQGVRPPVWDEVVGQPGAVAELRAAVDATHDDPGVPTSAMTHAWLFTGPPGSGRSTAARAFAAALQCPYRGCGECVHCRTAAAGTHADITVVTPEGLSIPVKLMRRVVAEAARRPSTARRQIVLIEDADRLTEAAANALLKMVEEPPEHTVFLLCAPSTHPDDVSVTIRSRCRVLSLRTPSADAIAEVLVRRDGVDPERARWAASVCAGHIGRARRLARDEGARARREWVLSLAGIDRLGRAVAAAAQLAKDADSDAKESLADRDAGELDELRTALGAGGTGRGAVGAARGTAGLVKELEGRQKTRLTRTQRDILDQALIELSGFYRDVVVLSQHAGVPLTHPDQQEVTRRVAAEIGGVTALRRLEAVLACREALELNVKPQIALEALMTTLSGVADPRP